MKIPGPDHPIIIAPNKKRVRVVFNGKVIADTTRALTLEEKNHPARQYIPREDADMSALQRTEHQTHCPYKGEASYFALITGSKTVENAVWSYEEPFPAVKEIAGYLAFYPDKVSAIEELPA